jgi:hypothetical protein
MEATGSTKVVGSPDRLSRCSFRPGDLVVSRCGYPVLFEVISIRADGLLRVRGVQWAPGSSTLVAVDDVRPTTGMLR